MFKHLLTAAVLLTLVSCGKSSRNREAETQISNDPPEFNQNETWAVVTKQCGSEKVDILPNEEYRLDTSHFIAVRRTTHEADRLCKTAFVYDRIISKFGWQGETYTESSLLRSAAAKENCWEKVDGKLVQPPASEIKSFGPEQLSFQMSATGRKIDLEIQRPEECSTGPLLLSLKKK